MFYKKEPPIVLSIGGSLIVPNGNIDSKFLSKLNAFIREQVKKGRRFFLVTGGGKTARHYRDAGRNVIGNLTNEDLDWLGIHASRLNGHLLRTIFQDIAHPRIIDNYDRKLSNWKEPVVIGAGWKPGWSTDYDAVILARDYKSRLLLNLSNIDWVYDKDPSQHADAKPFKRLTWGEMEELVGTEWTPGINAPFDPVAAQLAKQLKLTVVVMNGKNFKNLEDIIEGESFKGTVICPYHIDADYFDRDYYAGHKSGLRFFKRESWYGKLWRRMVNWYRAFVIKQLYKPKKVLDVGCGRGYLVHALRNMGIEAYGVDISEHAVELSHEDVKPHLRRADIMRLPYADNEFDVVVTFGVLEHVEQGKIKRAINETVRVARKRIQHTLHTTDNSIRKLLYRKDPAHVSLFSAAYWKKVFQRHDQVTLKKSSFYHMPRSFETAFVLEKKVAK